MMKMADQRLIDANALYEDWLETGENEYVYDTNSFLCSLDNAPTINPEDLPIVQQLRKELAQVKAERDAAEKDRAALANLELALCEEFCFGDMRSDIPPCEWYEDGACKLRKWRDTHAEAD